MSKTTINKTNNHHSQTLNIILCGLFTALTAVCAAISIPLPFTPVPISLTTLSVLLSGGILGSKSGVFSQVAYILLGAVGAPVFANFTGGFGILIGPTGGYIIGYIPAALVFGILVHRIFDVTSLNGTVRIILLFMAAVVSTITCYAVGTLWFMHVTGTHFAAAFGLCILPFIPGDLIKSFAAALLVKSLYSAVCKKNIW